MGTAMNIREAKEEVIRTVKAYTARNAQGEYLIPPQKQRPLLIIGPPGIGKTAIMEQAANECGVNLVSYTITHHTRQSAIGLPFIAHRSYGGKEMTVTEYSMSEIIASVYDQMEKSGVQEGILFLDEINCVSETLAPTMLQFLQYKTFGAHRLPEGFVIVTAGNPPQYNKSVRDFDIVTLDRIRRIEVTEDFAVWKPYAYESNVHGAVLAYLEIRRDHFYSIRTDVENRYFVTARGWEDLSLAMKAYEDLGLPVTELLVGEYLQDPEIARDFATYYELYRRYQEIYRIPDILEGRESAQALAVGGAPFDERLSLIGLLVDALRNDCAQYAEDLAVQKTLQGVLTRLPARIKAGEAAVAALRRMTDDLEADLAAKEDAKMIAREDAHIIRAAIGELRGLERKLMVRSASPAEGAPEVAPVPGASDAGPAGRTQELSPQADAGKAAFLQAKAWFDGREADRRAAAAVTSGHLTNAFRFMAKCFGEGQEMVIFLSELSQDSRILQFINANGNEEYFRYNKLLLLDERRQQLTEDILRLMP